MAITKFSARNATLKFSASAITFDLATNLDDETYGITIVSAKDVTFSPPKSEVEMVPLLGETAQTVGSNIVTTGTFQNVIMDEKAWTVGKITGTLVLTGDEQIEQIALGAGNATSGTNVSTRYGFGDTASGKARVLVGNVLVTLHNNLTDSSGEVVNVVMTKPFVNLGDIKPTSADGGHWEMAFEMTSLPGDCAFEVQD